MIPGPFAFILLALASYRTWYLLAEDVILDRVRRKLLRMGNWREDGDPIPDNYRESLADFIRCPRCLGFWVALAWFVAWIVFPYQTLVGAVAMALSAVLIFQRVKLDPPEEELE